MDMTQKQNNNGKWDLQIGDVITFTNSVNYKMIMKVTKITDKSWYASINGMGNGRNSFGTLERLSKYADFKIQTGV
jgi:hypothetical protein